MFWSSHSVSAASGFQPLFEFFLQVDEWESSKHLHRRDDDKMFDLKARARDGSPDVVRRCNNRVSVEHNCPVVCLNGILAAGNAKKVYLNHFVCVVERKTHTHTFQQNKSATVLWRRGQRYFCPLEGETAQKHIEMQRLPTMSSVFPV